MFLIVAPGSVPLLPLGLPQGASSDASRLLGYLGIEPIPPHAELRMFLGFQETS